MQGHTDSKKWSQSLNQKLCSVPQSYTQNSGLFISSVNPASTDTATGINITSAQGSSEGKLSTVQLRKAEAAPNSVFGQLPAQCHMTENRLINILMEIFK